MCTCEFCNTSFQPRPQVKSPRACGSCQGIRQRNNEYDWRKRNPKYSNAEYHELMRGLREKRIKAIAETLSQCVRVGKEMTGTKLEMKEFGLALTCFLLTLGVRRVNKFWLSEFAM
jgi:hypothetical protein